MLMYMDKKDWWDFIINALWVIFLSIFLIGLIHIIEGKNTEIHTCWEKTIPHLDNTWNQIRCPRSIEE